MHVIVFNSFVFLLAASLITYNTKFCTEYNINVKMRSRYLVLGLAVIVDALLYIFMDFCFETKVCYLLFTIDRFVRVLFMAEIFLISSEGGGVTEKYASGFVSFILYSSAALFFIDTLISGGKLMNGMFGVYYVPYQPLYKLLYFVLYFAYFVAFLVQIIFKYSSISKKREKPEFVYVALALLFCLLNQSIDIFAILIGSSVHFSHAVFELFSLFFIYREIMYHRSIMVMREDYQEELSPKNCEIAFVVDDSNKIVFCSKRAEVLAEVVEDKYVGRDFYDIFDLTDAQKEMINNNSTEDSIEVFARYNKLSKDVELKIKNRMDLYGEVISSCVIVLGMEPQEMSSVG